MSTQDLKLFDLLDGLEMTKSQYEWLARRFENMTAKEALLFRGAMQIEQPQATCDVMQIANQLEHYELLYGAGNDFALGNFVMEHRVREGYSGAYQPMAGDFEESLDYGDIYGRLDALLNLTNQSGYHVQYTEDGKMEFRVWDLSVDLQNASFASADSAGNRLIADCEIELEVPVSFGGRLLPPMRMTVKVSAGYTPRF